MCAESIVNDISWRGANVSRLVLGTAQLGMDYGVANASGQPSAQDATAIVERAWAEGIRFFDTAQAYGNSEKMLGRALHALGVSPEAKVISKLAPVLPVDDAARVRDAVAQSCERLGVERLWGMLLHRIDQIDAWAAVVDAIRDEGRVKHWGVSVYTVEEARRAAACSDIALIQAPCNAWDQRLRRSGTLAEAKERGKLVFVRSVYLQGLLVMTPEAVAAKLPRAGHAARRWRDIARDLRISPAELAVRFGMALDAPLVVGAESVGQVVETAAFARKGPLPEAMIEAIHEAMAPHLTDETVNPSLWGI